MSLQLPAASRCFIDANVLYYCFTEVPPYSQPCRLLLQRVEQGELIAHTTVQVLADVVHKTMLAEVAARHAQQRGGLIGWLKKHPDALKALSGVHDVVRRLLRLRLNVLLVEPSALTEAVAISGQDLLLTNDAVSVAVMRRHGLRDLVTNDDDFDGVAGLTIWKPR